MFIHKARMFDYDQSAGAGADNSGGTATATPPPATANPAAPAQQQQPAPSTESTTDPLAFKLPDSLEGDYADFRGKSVGDILKINKDLRDKHLRQSNELAELRKNGTKQTPAAVKPGKGKQAEAETTTETETTGGIGANDWNGYLRQYFRDEAEEGAAQEFADKFGLPVDVVLKVAETQRKEREAFYQQAAGDLGDVTPVELERWLESEHSGLSPEALAGIIELSSQGNTGWVKGMVEKYRKWTEAGNARMDGKGGVRQPVYSMERGRVAGSETPDIYATKEDYQRDLLEAGRKGDNEAMRKADEKMQRSAPYWARQAQELRT